MPNLNQQNSEEEKGVERKQASTNNPTGKSENGGNKSRTVGKATQQNTAGNLPGEAGKTEQKNRIYCVGGEKGRARIIISGVGEGFNPRGVWLISER